MRTTKIEIDIFDPQSLKDAIKELKAWKTDFKQRVDRFVQTLAEEGYKDIKYQIVTLKAVNTQELLNSLNTVESGKRYKGHSVYYVVADCEYACFVEFGTGVVGKKARYPYRFPRGTGWKYDVGVTIREGADGVRGWFFPAKDGKWYWTNGQASRPFMSNGFREMVNNVEALAIMYFK